MKKRRIFYLFPFLGLILSGCSLEEGALAIKNWVKTNILENAKTFIDKINGEQTPASTDEQQEEHHEEEGEGQHEHEEPVHEHSFNEGWEQDKTHHWHVCVECGEVLDKAEHTWDEGVVTSQPSCFSSGVFTYTCTVCGATKTETIASQHDTSGEWLHDNVNHWKECSKCGEKILEAPHEWGDPNHLVLPTKFETGLDEYTCEVCGETKQEVVEKLSDMNLNVLFVGTALLRGNAAAGFTTTFEGLCNDMDGRKMNVSMEDSLTPGSGYTFKALSEETTIGNNLRTALTDNEYDVIVLQISRQISKGHDSVAESEKAALKSIESLLKAETSQIYLLTYPSDASYNVYDVDENGNYVKGAKDTTTGAKANSHYYFEVAQDMAEDIDAKVCNYAESYISLEENMERHQLTSAKADLVSYLRAVCLYESMFNKRVTDESTYQNGTNLNDNELHYLRRYASEFCFEHEHVLANEVLFNSEYHWKECEICNHIDHLEAHNLVKEDSSYVAPDCTHAGHAHFACSECGYEKDEEYAQLDHTILDAWINDGDTHYQACETCDGKFNVESHTWGAGVVTTAATHLEYGEMTYTCTKCGATKVEQIDKLSEHTFGNWIKVDDDVHTRSCECGESETENHTWDSGTRTKEPTFTEEGIMTYTCTKCGATYTEAIPVMVHTDHTADATWHTDSEYHWHICTFEGCGEFLDKAEHSWDAGVVTTEATHLNEGVKTYTCSVCGATKQEVIPQITEHSFGNWIKVDDDVHTRSCECGESETENHTWNEGEITTVPTRTSDGVKTYTCTKCGATKTEELEKLSTNVLMLGTANMDTYSMDKHLDGIAQDEGYKKVTAQYLTTGSGYSFKKLLDTSAEDSFGSQLLSLLEKNDFDVIIVSLTRMVTKGSDDVIAAEDEYLETLAPILLSETSEIYLMSFNIDWQNSPKVYSVNESGEYVAGGASQFDDKVTSKYFDTLGEGWATEYGFKLLRYSSCYVEFREAGNGVSSNTLQYMQGVLLYTSIFNKLLKDSTQYHKTIKSSFSDSSALNIRNHTVGYGTYQAE